METSQAPATNHDSPLPPAEAALPVTLQIRLPRPERWGVILALALAILFNLVMFRHEATIDAPPLNDNVVHLVNVQRAAEAIRQGQDPTDLWIPDIDLGYPLFHHYQHLSYQLPALAVALSGGAISPEAALRWATVLLFAFWPLPLYWAGRRFGFGRLASLLAAVLGPLLATYGLYGLDAFSYTWVGFGLYTQLWAAWLFPPALAQAYATLRTGKGYLLAVALVAALLLSHLVYAYMLFASLAMLVLLAIWRPKDHEAVAPGDTWIRRLWRLLTIVGLAALVSAYFVLPYFMHQAHANRTVWLQSWKYDSFGLGWVAQTLFDGNMFDAGRFPSLTLLVGAGIGVCLWQWRHERYRLLPVLTLMWLLLYAGRPTWGVLMDLLPMGSSLILHRFIGGLHFGAIYLMGVGLAWPWRWALARADRRTLLIPAALTLLLLVPVYRERAAFFQQNAASMRTTADAVAAERADLDALVATIQELPPGRVYAGLAGRWGAEIKVGAVPLYAYLNGMGLDVLGHPYHALSLNADIQVLFDDGKLEQYQLFNVRYVITPQGWTVPAFYTPLGDYGRFRLYEVPSGGYFDLVDSDMAFVGRKDDFYGAASTWLTSELLRAKQHPTIALGAAPLGYRALYPLEEAPAEIPLLTVTSNDYRGEVLREEVGSNWYEAEVEVVRESWLMLKVTYHPGWRAYVNGERAETVMLMPSYVGVRLSPGQHTVRLVYSGGAGRAWLMALGLLTLALLWLAERRPDLTARLRERLLGASGKASYVPGQEIANGGGAAVSVRDELAEPATESGPAPVAPRKLLGLYLVFLAIYLVSGAGHFFSTDHVSVYWVTESLLESGELALPEQMHDSVQGPDGKYYSMYGIGQSLVAMPFYILGRTVEQIATPEVRRFFSGVDLGQWGGAVPIYFVSLTNQFLSPLLCLLVLAFCLRLGFSRRASLATTFVFGLSTATWVYARDSFQHPLESLMLLLSIYLLYTHRGQLRPKQLLLAGCALGMGILTRSNLVLTAPLLAAYLFCLAAAQVPGEPLAPDGSSAQGARLGRLAGRLRDLWRRGVAQGALRCIALYATPVTLAVILVLYLNYVRYGSFLAFHPMAQAYGFSTPAWVGLYGNLLSPGRSLFLFSPPLILGLWAARGFYRKHKAEALLFGALVILYLLFYSLYSYWDGGWSWGPRLILPVLPLLTIPIAGYLHTRGRAIALALLALLGTLVQLAGVVVNYSYIHHEWLEMGLNPAKAFLFVPQLSPIPTHWQALLSGRHVDLWLREVWRGFGPATFALTLLVPVGILGAGLALTGAPAAAAARIRPWLAARRREAPSAEA